MVEVVVQVTNVAVPTCHVCAARRIRLVCNARDPNPFIAAAITSYNWTIVPPVALPPSLDLTRHHLQLPPGTLQDGAEYYVSCCAGSIKGTGCAVNLLHPVWAPQSGTCQASATANNLMLLSCTGWIAAVGPLSYRWMRQDGTPLSAGSSTANSFVTDQIDTEYKVEITDGRECHALSLVVATTSGSLPTVSAGATAALQLMATAQSRGSSNAVLQQCALVASGDFLAAQQIVAWLVDNTTDARADFVHDVARCLCLLQPVAPAYQHVVLSLAVRLGNFSNPEFDSVLDEALQFLTCALSCDPLRPSLFVSQLAALRNAVVFWTQPNQPSEPIYSASAVSWTAQDGGSVYPLRFSRSPSAVPGPSLVANTSLCNAIPNQCGGATFVLLSATTLTGDFQYTSPCPVLNSANTSCWVLLSGADSWTMGQGCIDCTQQGAAFVCCQCPWSPDMVAVTVVQIAPATDATNSTASVTTGYVLTLGSWAGLIALGVVALIGAVLLGLLYQQLRKIKAASREPVASFAASDEPDMENDDQERWLLPAARQAVGVAAVTHQTMNMWWQPWHEKEHIN
jgi:hypothetical protein